MHPAPSVILFTTASGAGYGLLFLIGLLAPLGALPSERWFGALALGLALIAVTGGLMASTFHLGHPERAWRALGQWRSSWLSREGVAALLTYVPTGLYGLGWVVFGAPGGANAAFGLLAALGAGATVYCTAMIYRTLKPIPQWHNRWVVPAYGLLGLMTGALLLQVALAVHDAGAGPVSGVTALAILAAAAAKVGYWRHIDRRAPVATAESATGLEDRGALHLLDPPHTEENYLLREMAFRVARRHAGRLRRLVVLSAFALPLMASLPLAVADGAAAIGLASLAAISGLAGTAIERWLFFAEARHTVTLYYGARAV